MAANSKPSTFESVIAAFTVVAVPLVAGSVPSVVYVMRLTPEPVPSLPLMSMSIGTAFVQPPAHGLLSQVMALVGATASECASKLVPAPVRPASFWAVTEPVSVFAVASKL